MEDSNYAVNSQLENEIFFLNEWIPFVSISKAHCVKITNERFVSMLQNGNLRIDKT